ncbi:MAG: glyoxalase [Ignavibacteriales bacterium CG12_big_fil_rev_8_21_14_0_65_30_8]|nr:MAG: glyoxalase [Ignavibacteriales bacterium CG12_big_fil_rev_8_21_14_0_65_30_8]
MDYKISPDTQIGHVHLTVKNLNRSLKFYRDLLGYKIKAWYRDSAVFLSANDYHHHIALNTWEGEKATPRPPGHTGLYHFAILYPNRKELALAFKKLWEEKYPVQGATDSGISESIYISDPDGNGIELYCDRPEYDWPRDEKDNIVFETKEFDLLELLAELDT